MSKKNDILENINKDINKSKSILKEKGLFLYEKDLIYDQNSFLLENKPSMTFHQHLPYYLDNRDSFVFKFIDESIIQAGFTTDKRNKKITQYRMVFISSPFDDDQINMFSESIPENEKKKVISDDLNKMKANIINYYFDKVFNKDTSEENKTHLVESFIALANNPIIIRADYDENCSSENHPLAHITINNYPHSRFKINDMIDISRFIIFVLDFVYGTKLVSGTKLSTVNVHESFLNIGISG